MDSTNLDAIVRDFHLAYDEKQKSRVWEEQRDQFRRFWNERIRGARARPISDDDCDSIVRILDRSGKGNNRESESVARTMIPQGSWRRMLNEFRENRALGSLVESIFEEVNVTRRARLIDELYAINASRRNRLTGPSGSAISALLAAYDPFRNLSVISLNDRRALIEFLELQVPFSWSSSSIGNKIAVSNKILLDGLESIGVGGSARTGSAFCYFRHMKALWKPESEVVRDTAKIGIGKFFAEVLGAKLHDNRKSWGAVDSTGHRIYLRVWDDEFGKIKGKESIQVSWKALTGFGAKERSRHLDAIRAGAEAFAVVCTPKKKEKNDSTIKIKSFDSATLLRLGNLVDEGRSTSAMVTMRVAVDELFADRAGVAAATSDIGDVLADQTLSKTVQDALVRARLGQGRFRKDVLSLWGNRCAVTGCSVTEAIRASHIKPWRDSDNAARLDPYNGLPLAAHLDALFDIELISFEDDGSMLISSRLSSGDLKLLGIVDRRLRQPVPKKMLAYLRHHRSKFHGRTASNGEE